MRPAKEHFRAFISYSHKCDRGLAPKLQKALEVLNRPWWRARSLRIFRDVTNLSVTPTAWEEIKSALLSSDYLILIASPAAAQSKWVVKEVETWKREKSIDNLLIVLGDGTIQWSESSCDFDWTATTALPTVLRGTFTAEPLYASFIDLAPDQFSLRNPEFLDRAASIAAPIHKCNKDGLIGDHLRRRRRIRWAASILLIVIVSVIALWQFEQKRRHRAESLRRAMESLTLNGAKVENAHVDFLVSSNPVLTRSRWGEVNHALIDFAAEGQLSSLKLDQCEFFDLTFLTKQLELRELHIDGASLTSGNQTQIDWSPTSSLRQLKRLVLRYVPFNDKAVGFFPKQPHLVELRLTEVTTSAAGLTSLLKCTPQLQILTIRDCPKAVISDELANQIAKLTALRTLEITGCRGTSSARKILQALGRPDVAIHIGFTTDDVDELSDRQDHQQSPF